MQGDSISEEVMSLLARFCTGLANGFITNQLIQDLEVIGRFRSQQGWGDHAQPIHAEGKGILLDHDAVYIAMRWDSVDTDLIKRFEMIFRRSPIALIYGDPTKEQAAKIYEDSNTFNFGVAFVDQIGQEVMREFVRQADGPPDTPQS